MFFTYFLSVNCFLGVWSLKAGSTGGSSGDLDQDTVSQHMSRLYQSCSAENRLKEGNTVRSFRAAPDLADQKIVYQLNLSALQESEVILSATFHFPLERRPHQKNWFCKRFKSPSCRPSATLTSQSISLIFRSVHLSSRVSSGSMGSFLGNVTFHPHRRGVWQMKDVTQVIKQARDKGHVLVSVELDVGQQYHRTSSPGNLPYLLVYADDVALSEPNSVAMGLQRYDPLTQGGESIDTSQSQDLKGRVRREATSLPEPIQNNELPEVDYMPEGHRKDDLWESAWYLAVKPKLKAEKQEKKRKIQQEERVEQNEGVSNTEVSKETKRTSERQSPDNSTEKRHKESRTTHRRHDGRDGRKLKGSPQTKSPVLNFDEQTMRIARRRQWAEPQHRGCSRRNLRVDFADIGWSEWVIAPKAFEAYYCAGTCGFPMSKVARPSNHATIQSIVRAVGIVPGVPEPCCVPEKMKPLPVLFLDESTNPVLKIYPNMSVQSCSCR
ncbi:growth/differentiation factor 10 [Synchiropus picturatus]